VKGLSSTANFVENIYAKVIVTYANANCAIKGYAIVARGKFKNLFMYVIRAEKVVQCVRAAAGDILSAINLGAIIAILAVKFAQKVIILHDV
jgi:hypothetical protein